MKIRKVVMNQPKIISKGASLFGATAIYPKTLISQYSPSAPYRSGIDVLSLRESKLI